MLITNSLCCILRQIMYYTNWFISTKSTDLALRKFVANITLGLGKHEHLEAIAMVLSKVFDCIGHSPLIIKLDSFRTRGTPEKWLKSYLNGRSQTIKIWGKFSNEDGLYTRGPSVINIWPNFILNVHIQHFQNFQQARMRDHCICGQCRLFC